MSAPRAAGRGVALFLLFGLALAAHHDLISGLNWRWGDDVLEYAVPFSRFLVGSLARGETPLWNPHEDCGATLFANPMYMGPFYPAALLYLLPSGWALNLGYLLHIALAAYLAFLLARVVGLGAIPSVLTGLLFASSSALRVQVAGGYLPNAVSVAWLPGVIAALEWGRRSGRTAVAAALAGAAWGLAVLGGNVMCAFAGLGSVFVWGLFRAPFGDDGEMRRGGAWYWPVVLAGVAAIGGLVGAVVLWPTYGAYLDAAPGAGRELRVFEFLAWEPWRILQAAVMGANPGITGSLFTGFCGTVLAVLGLTGDRSTPRLRAAAGATLTALYLLFISPSIGLYDAVVTVLPPFRLFSGPYAFADVLPLFIALFAGFGLQRLIAAGMPGRREGAIAGAAAAVLCGFAVAYALAYRANPQPRPLNVVVPVFAAAVVLAAVLWHWRRSRLPASVGAVILCAVCGVEMAAYCTMSRDRPAVAYRDDVYFDRTAITQAALEAAPVYRILPYETLHLSEFWQIQRNEGMVQGYHSAFGNAKIPTRRFTEFASLAEGLKLLRRPFFAMVQNRRAPPAVELGDRDLKILSMMNVKYVASDAPLAGSGALFVPGPRVGETTLFTNPHALPRVYALGRVLGVADDRTALAALAAPGFDPWTEVVLTGAPSLDGAGICRDVRLQGYANGAAAVDALGCSGRTALVLADQFSADWRAAVDGVETEVHPANHLFRGVLLGDGDHRVVFTYTPRRYRAGALVSHMAWAALALAAAVVLWRKRRA